MRIAFFALVLVAALGCAPRELPPSSFEARGLKVGKIAVTLDTTSLDPERTEVFNKVGGTQSVKEELSKALLQRNMLVPSSDVTLSVTVNEFRLRHGATRYFTGFFSGSDTVAGKVELLRGKQTVSSFRTEVSGGNGNPFNVSRDSRSDGLFRGFAARVVEQLRRQAIE